VSTPSLGVVKLSRGNNPNGRVKDHSLDVKDTEINVNMAISQPNWMSILL